MPKSLVCPRHGGGAGIGDPAGPGDGDTCVRSKGGQEGMFGGV